MIFRNLTELGDWTFGRGKQDFTSRNRAVGLNIQTRLNSWVGDCFFDQNAGIDWLNRLGSKNQKAILELDLRRVILETDGVTDILSFDTIYTDREFTASYTVKTIYTGQISSTLYSVTGAFGLSTESGDLIITESGLSLTTEG